MNALFQVSRRSRMNFSVLRCCRMHRRGLRRCRVRALRAPRNFTGRGGDSVKLATFRYVAACMGEGGREKRRNSPVAGKRPAETKIHAAIYERHSLRAVERPTAFQTIVPPSPPPCVLPGLRHSSQCERAIQGVPREQPRASAGSFSSMICPMSGD